MKAIPFDQQTVNVTGEGYQDLPTFYGEYDNGQRVAISKWKLTWWERVKVLFGQAIWLHTFTEDLTTRPVLLSAEDPKWEAPADEGEVG